MPWPTDKVRSLYRDYLAGMSLHDLARREQVSYETIRQAFEEHGLARRSPEEVRAQKQAAVEAQAEQERDKLIALYKELGSIDLVMDETTLPRKVVSEIIATIPNRESFRRKGATPLYTRDVLISSIKRAAEIGGEPLSVPVYRDLAPKHGLVAYATIIRHFSSEDHAHPWEAALKAAGVEANEPRGQRSGSITPQECVDAVARCIQENGGERVSYRQYSGWASDRNNGTPAGPTVRVVVPGGWSAAVEEALRVC